MLWPRAGVDGGVKLDFLTTFANESNFLGIRKMDNSNGCFSGYRVLSVAG